MALEEAPVTPFRDVISRHGPGAFLVVILAIATLFLLPPGDPGEAPVYEIGSVADATVIAPFAFQVPRPEDEVERERQRLMEAVPPLFVFDASAIDSVRLAINKFSLSLDSIRLSDSPLGRDSALFAIRERAEKIGINFTDEEAEWLAFPARRSAALTGVRRTFERTLPEGIAAPRALDGVMGTVQVARGDAERSTAVDAVPSWSEVLRAARLLHPDASSVVADGAYQKLLTGMFIPSLRFDSATTASRREEAAAGVDAWRFEVRSGEKIIGAHEVVREEDHARLAALRDIVREGSSGLRNRIRTLGTLFLNLSVIGVFFVALAFYRPEIYGRPRALAVAGVCILIVIGGAGVALRIGQIPGAMIPIGVAALLISILFDSRIALICALVLSVLLGVQPAFQGVPVLLFALSGGTAAAFSVRSLERRAQFVRSIISIATAYMSAAVIAGLAFGWVWSDVVMASALGALNAVFSVALAMALLPPAEEACGVDTYLKLLEWSDLNQPLLRRLAVEAPGTWAHTMSMAGLVEAAVRAVGGNALLARVGTYYHDIGKLDRPGYFVENQPRGRNPHDKLKPAASASIIRNHVREGLVLAAEYKLPRSIRTFISEHHGTGPISFFLEKARERDSAISQSGEFTYPGPTPRSIETAICMLGDGAEAATRVLQDPTEAKLREVVDAIVRTRIDQGQLTHAPITLAQLETVKSEFVRVLAAMRHGRIEYPGPHGVTASGRADPPPPAIVTP